MPIRFRFSSSSRNILRSSPSTRVLGISIFVFSKIALLISMRFFSLALLSFSLSRFSLILFLICSKIFFCFLHWFFFFGFSFFFLKEIFFDFFFEFVQRFEISEFLEEVFVRLFFTFILIVSARLTFLQLFRHVINFFVGHFKYFFF